MKYHLKLKITLILFITILFPITANAQRGCCSHHGGVAGCNENGRQICNDGTLSPTCTCTPTVSYVYGCTDSTAKNYNKEAEKSDNSCEYYIYGCIDKEAKNYNENAEKDDNSCEYYNYGCTNSDAINYDSTADKDDGSCEFKTETVSSSDNDSSGILSVLALGGVGAGIYYFKKKKQNKE